MGSKEFLTSSALMVYCSSKCGLILGVVRLGLWHP